MADMRSYLVFKEGKILATTTADGVLAGGVKSQGAGKDGHDPFIKPQVGCNVKRKR
jgi:hypothetical protein